MIQSGAATDRGRVRELNEDSCACFSAGDTLVAVVADGMGGHNAGEVASAAAVDKISEYLKENLETEPVRDCLLHAVEAANGFVYKKARSDRRYTAMGTTAVLCCVRDGCAYIANVGDSRAYLVGEDIVQVTEDHSVVEELLRRGEITKNEALTHPHRNMITRALGTEPRVLPDLFRCELSPGGHPVAVQRRPVGAAGRCGNPSGLIRWRFFAGEAGAVGGSGERTRRVR